MNSMSTVQIPNWLLITKIGDGHFRVSDASVEASGLYLGSFPTLQSARHFAIKVAEARAETRTRNLRRLQSGQRAGASLGL